MLLSVHLMIYFLPWNHLLALCPLVFCNYILTNFIYAIVFKLFCILKEKFLFYWGFFSLAPKQNFLASHEIPSSILSAQVPGKCLHVLFSCSIFLFSRHLYLLLAVLDPFLNSTFFFLFPLVCMCMLYMVVYGLHASPSVHVEFKEQPWASVLPTLLFWDRLSLLFNTTNPKLMVCEHQRFFCLCLMLPRLTLHGVSGFKIRSSHLCANALTSQQTLISLFKFLLRSLTCDWDTKWQQMPLSFTIMWNLAISISFTTLLTNKMPSTFPGLVSFSLDEEYKDRHISCHMMHKNIFRWSQLFILFFLDVYQFFHSYFISSGIRKVFLYDFA